jgi:hypothetical protein
MLSINAHRAAKPQKTILLRHNRADFHRLAFASLIVALCVTIAALAPFRLEEGTALDLFGLTFSCVGILTNPAIFAAFWSRQCRVRSRHVTLSTAIPWVGSAIFQARQNQWVLGVWIAIAVAASAGLAFGYGVLRRQSDRFRQEETVRA